MKKIVITLLMLLSAKVGFSQNAEKHFRPETPAIARFLQYDDLAINEYAGLPDISIPIYTIAEDELELPLNLVYHGGGIKVNQQASWVGLGWDLKLGTLVQIINDEDDFKVSVSPGVTVERMLPDYPSSSTGTGNISAFPKRYEFPYSAPGVGWVNPYPSYPLRKEHVFKTTIDYFLPVNGEFDTRRINFFVDRPIINYDSEPDIFEANLLNVNIHFMMDWQTGEFVVLNKKGYKIVKSGDQWIITNPMGEQFYFEQKIETISNLVSSANGGSVQDRKLTMRTWLLNKIITRNGKLIKIEYERTANVEMPETEMMTHKMKSFNTTIMLSDENRYGMTGNELMGVISNKSKAEEPYYFIKRITSPKVVIDFKCSPRMDISGSKRLDNVSISNHVGQVVKKFNFQYDYFVQKDSKRRLKLKSVKEDKDGFYEFDYDIKYALPAINSYQQDCWGYYNGHSNSNLIPNASRYYLPDWSEKPDNGNNMSSRLEYARVGTLNQIKYPTGGKVAFEYELHTFNNYLNRVPDYTDSSLTSNTGITKGHGLRLKEVSYKDKDDKIIKKIDYTYEGGKAILPKQFFRRTSYAELLRGGLLPTDYKIRMGYLSESTVSGYLVFNPLSSFDGVGYTKVIKRVVGSDIHKNERIETDYYNNPDIVIRCLNLAIISLPAYKNDVYPSNGSISKICYYDANNKLLNKQAFTYRNSISSLYYGARSCFYDYLMKATMGNYYEYSRDMVGYYPIFDFETLLTRKDETTYSNGIPLTKAWTYTYNANNILSNYTENISETSGKIDVSYTFPNSQSSDPALKKMATQNRIAEIVTSTTVRNQGTPSNYTNKKFVLDGSKIRLSSVEQRMNPSSPLIDKVDYSYGVNHDNPVQMMGIDGMPVTYIWGYNGEYPVAEIKNETYENVKGKLTNTVVSDIEKSAALSADSWKRINQLRVDLPNANITTFSHIPLVGTDTIVNERGIKHVYKYDDSGRLTVVRDMNGNIVNRTVYHLGELSEGFSKPIITSVEKVNKSYYINFTVDEEARNKTIYIRTYCINTGTTLNNHAGYSDGRRPLSDLTIGYTYLFYIGIVDGPESDQFVYKAQ